MDWGAIASILAERSDRPIALLDKSGHIRLFNHAMEQILGWTRFEVEGQLWARACTPPDQETEAKRWIGEALRGALRSYDAIAHTNKGGRIGFRFEFSLVGRGPAQALLVTATHTTPVQAPIGPLQGQDLDYEVASTGDQLGVLQRISVNGESIRLVQDEMRCFAVIYGGQGPCEGCPLLRDDVGEAWPRISVRACTKSGNGHPKTYEIKTAERVSEAIVRVRLRVLPDRTLEAIHAAKVHQLAERADLSPREREVLSYLLLGRNIDEIAQLASIAVRTVKYHQANVLEKLGADSRADLMRLLF